MLLHNIFRALNLLLRLLNLAIFVYCITTWVAPSSRVRYYLERFIEPIVSPFRRLSAMLMRRTGLPLDFSCLFAMIALEIAQTLLVRLYYMIV